MLPNSPEVKAVALGADGIIEGRIGLVFVDMSSIAPLVAREITMLSQKRYPHADAPVSGGEPKAIDGTLSVWSAATSRFSTRSRTC